MFIMSLSSKIIMPDLKKYGVETGWGPCLIFQLLILLLFSNFQASYGASLWSFPDSSVGKESGCNAGDPGSIPGLGRSAGEVIGYPLQYSCASLWLSWWRICLQCGRPGFDPWVGKATQPRSPLQYSGLDNSMDYIDHGVKSIGHNWSVL